MSSGTSPGVDNSLFVSWLISRFVEKKYFYGNVGTYKKVLHSRDGEKAI